MPPQRRINTDLTVPLRRGYTRVPSLWLPAEPPVRAIEEEETNVRKVSWITACLLLVACTAAVAADSNEEPKWYDKVSFGGDFRLRYELFNWDDHFDDGRRDRFRFRLRFGAKYELMQNVTLGFQLRSGNPQNPISDNQSFDDGFDKKRISIAQAYVQWQGTEWFSLIGGKFRPKNLWIASDMQWDDDVVVEGANQNFSWKFGGALKAVKANLYQLVMNESGDNIDSYRFGAQVAPVFKLGQKNEIMVGVTYETLENPSAVASLYFKDKLVIDSGYVTNFVDPVTQEVLSDFEVGNVMVEWKNKSLKNWPIKLTGYYFKNFGAEDAVGAILPTDDGDPVLAIGNPADNDSAWFGRVQFGDYKKPGQVSVRFSRYYSEPDAIYFAYAQSDSRRSSNVDGFRTDVRIGMPKKGFVNVTWYQTDWTIGDDTTMNRFQFDYIFKFGDSSIP